VAESQLDERAAAAIVRDLVGEEIDADSLTRLLEPRAATVSLRSATAQDHIDAQRRVCVDDALAQALKVPAAAEHPTTYSVPWAAGVELRVALPAGTVEVTVQLSDAGIDELVTSSYAIAGERGVRAARAALGAVVMLRGRRRRTTVLRAVRRKRSCRAAQSA
jgi:ribosomal protein L12E/L44/L45/RPP1/RPP2